MNVMENVIAIIPAKATSERVPGKNRRLLLGEELYQYSVMYATAEGVKPVVSTDDEDIVAWCEKMDVACVREVVDDSNMVNCIDQVLAQVDCRYFALLQPTSPLRRLGLLRTMMEVMKSRYCPSIYTARKLKIIGHIGSEFQFATRDQDPQTRFLYQFDGNLLVVDADWYASSHRLFDDSSQSIEQEVPFSLQIDTETDFKVFDALLQAAL
jgi:N-acylneuraminate cytidylyltransferase